MSTFGMQSPDRLYNNLQFTTRKATNEDREIHQEHHAGIHCLHHSTVDSQYAFTEDAEAQVHSVCMLLS